jgi:hypothetical protein
MYVSPDEWKTLCLSASDLPGFEAWGALVGKQLAASVMTFQLNDWTYMLYQQCDRVFLPDYVNHALAFVVTQEMMSRRRGGSILYGLHSLDAPPSVDEFKFRMGYRAIQVRQRVVFHPLLAPFVNRASHAFVSRLLALRPGNVVLSKAEGMIRFYLEGQRSLADQVWPEVLRNGTDNRDDEE